MTQIKKKTCCVKFSFRSPGIPTAEMFHDLIHVGFANFLEGFFVGLYTAKQTRYSCSVDSTELANINIQGGNSGVEILLTVRVSLNAVSFSLIAKSELNSLVSLAGSQYQSLYLDCYGDTYTDYGKGGNEFGQA